MNALGSRTEERIVKSRFRCGLENRRRSLLLEWLPRTRLRGGGARCVDGEVAWIVRDPRDGADPLVPIHAAHVARDPDHLLIEVGDVRPVLCPRNPSGGGLGSRAAGRLSGEDGGVGVLDDVRELMGKELAGRAGRGAVLI